MKTLFLILVLFLVADLIYGTVQANKIKTEFQTYNHEMLSTVSNIKKVEQPCPNSDKKTCTFSLVTLTFKDNQNQEINTEVTNMGLEQTKIAEQISVLCDTKEWVCLPKSYLDTRFSIPNNMLTVSTIKALL